MSAIERYNSVFIEAFGVDEGQLAGLEYQSVEEWDSVGHMAMTAMLEDEFDIMLETDDIIDFSSYEKGKEILAKYGVEF
jgi:acyl carrier protein